MKTSVYILVLDGVSTKQCYLYGIFDFDFKTHVTVDTLVYRYKQNTFKQGKNYRGKRFSQVIRNINKFHLKKTIHSNFITLLTNFNMELRESRYKSSCVICHVSLVASFFFILWQSTEI